MNIIALLAGLFSGIAGAMGLGGGAVLIIFIKAFTDYSQLEAGGINLLFFVPIALIAVIIYAKRKEIEFKTVGFMALGGILGAFIGIFAAGYIGDELLGKIFGAVLTLVGIKQIFTK